MGNTVETPRRHQSSFIPIVQSWDLSLVKSPWELLNGPAGVRDAQSFVRSDVRMQKFLVEIHFLI